MLQFFETYIVQPVFNLLVFIYSVIPGHDFGIAIVLFTVVIRILLWPLLRKQLHHARAMRNLQPELKKLKKVAKGDRQKEMQLQMELYKERGIKPMASIGTLAIQLPIFIALYQAILKITNNPETLSTFTYDWVRNLSWMQYIVDDIARFDERLFGIVSLAEHGIQGGSWYFPAFIIAGLSTFAQYHQTKLTMMNTQDARKLSEILKDAASGKEADQTEVTAAVSKFMLVVLPFFTFIFALIVPAALSLYMLVSSAVGYFQTKHILAEDAEEMHEIAAEEPEEKTAPVKKQPQKTGKIVTKTTITRGSVKSEKPVAKKKKRKR
jgi:YidC/Oxa1 family membrane protein insertase